MVFPFVPVTQIIRTPRERTERISCFSDTAILPGREVAPLPSKLRTAAAVFAINNVKNVILNYIEKNLIYDKINIKQDMGDNCYA